MFPKNRKYRILVVDDTPMNIDMLETILSDEGYEVHAATNGKESIALANTMNPDLILLDIVMPGMDGYEACRTIKSNPEIVDVPIIFLTSKSESEDVVKGFKAGAVDFVSKPFHGAELLARVNTHIQLIETRREAERLLLNVLPSPIAKELRENGSRFRHPRFGTSFRPKNF